MMTAPVRSKIRALMLAGLVLGAGWAGAADARVYQWVNQHTGRAQLSGTPPPWYRSVRPGPRVLVFDRGILIDDTALAVGEEHRERLRRTAFEEAVQRRELVALQRLEEKARREAARAEREVGAARSARVSRAEAEDEGPDPEEPANSLEKFGSETIERLKAIIAEFDRLGGEAPTTGN